MANFFASKTIWGTVILVLGWMSNPEVLNVLPPKVAAIVSGIGALLASIGLRHAIAKNGQGK